MKDFKKAFEAIDSNFDAFKFENVLRSALKIHGCQESMIINMEELSELTQAISKQLRNQGDYYNLVEEIADVIISIHFLKYQYNIPREDILKAINVKINRIDKRNKEIVKNKE